MGRDFCNVSVQDKVIKNKFSVFLYDLDPTKEDISGGANIRKSDQKLGLTNDTLSSPIRSSFTC